METEMPMTEAIYLHKYRRNIITELLAFCNVQYVTQK